MFQSRVNDVTLTCMARMLRGMSSRYCRMVKCHVLILIRSSKANSSIKRPSVQTWTKITKLLLPHIPLCRISLSVIFNRLAGRRQLIWTQTKTEISVYWPGVILIENAGRVSSLFLEFVQGFCSMERAIMLPIFTPLASLIQSICPWASQPSSYF